MNRGSEESSPIFKKRDPRGWRLSVKIVKNWLSSQFSRIKQTIEKILDEDISLTRKTQADFQGARVNDNCSTDVAWVDHFYDSNVSLTGGATNGSTTPPKNPNKVGEWVKNKLKALARLLGRLAGKAAAALPGIIGSIVVGILNFLKKIVTAAAGHVWLFLTSIATLIGYRLMYQTKSQKAIVLRWQK